MQYSVSKFKVSRHIGDYMSPSAKRMYRAAIIMDYANQCPSTFYKGKVHLEVSIEVRTKVITRYPKLDMIASLYTEALSVIALERATQIIRLDIKKVQAIQEEMVVTITPVL
jgi:Holliday junction resolvase RusA-like endonuclease